MVDTIHVLIKRLGHHLTHILLYVYWYLVSLTSW